jgi:hypothetical protein
MVGMSVAEGGVMSAGIEEFRQKLAQLGARIDAKVQELRAQGVLHGAARQKVAELQMQHARVLKSATEHRGIGGVIAAELATDAEILRHSFELWVAQIDRESESK